LGAVASLIMGRPENHRLKETVLITKAGKRPSSRRTGKWRKTDTLNAERVSGDDGKKTQGGQYLFGGRMQ